MFDRSLAHTKWLFNPKIWAANWAAPSGDSVVGQPRPVAKRQPLNRAYFVVKQNTASEEQFKIVFVSAARNHMI